MSTGMSIGRYSDYTQDHRYEYDSGVVVLPVASRVSAHRRIRLHGGFGMRVVKWRAERLGKPPIVPPHQHLINDRLLSSTVIAQLPLPNPQSGTLTFHMEGEYVYVQNSPRLVGTNAIPTGSHPYPVEPSDGIAAQVITPALAQFSEITNLTSFDLAMDAVTTRIVNSGTEINWPIGVYPVYFTGQTIAG